MDLVASVVSGGSARRALARVLSLCESRLAWERAAGEQAARELWRRGTNENNGATAARVGFTGPPGAGKCGKESTKSKKQTNKKKTVFHVSSSRSSLVEALGCALLARGSSRVGVLCVDPSSALSGGSILGDRTRMTTLSNSDSAFVRASSSGGDEGGLNAAARHQLLALEGWVCLGGGGQQKQQLQQEQQQQQQQDGFVLVETVGVGQSEHEVEGNQKFDFFLFLFPLNTRC